MSRIISDSFDKHIEMKYFLNFVNYKISLFKLCVSLTQVSCMSTMMPTERIDVAEGVHRILNATILFSFFFNEYSSPYKIISVLYYLHFISVTLTTASL